MNDRFMTVNVENTCKLTEFSVATRAGFLLYLGQVSQNDQAFPNPNPMNKEIIRTQVRELLETINEQFESLSEYKEKIPQIEFDLILENIRKLYEEMHLLQRIDDPFEHVRTAAPKPRPEPEPDLFSAAETTFSIKLQEAREEALGPKPNPADHLKTHISINDKFIFINELFDGNLREYNETIETLNGFRDRRQAMEFFDLVRTKNRWDPGTSAYRKLQEMLEKKFA